MVCNCKKKADLTMFDSASLIKHVISGYTLYTLVVLLISVLEICIHTFSCTERELEIWHISPLSKHCMDFWAKCIVRTTQGVCVNFLPLNERSKFQHCFFYASKTAAQQLGKFCQCGLRGLTLWCRWVFLLIWGVTSSLCLFCFPPCVPLLLSDWSSTGL